jgi:flagellar biosynthesis/type III secretory pathway protein FliH
MGDSKPPSRRRYEEQNPTVSFRISKEKKEKLNSLVNNLEVTKKEWFESIIDEESTKCSAVFQQGLTKGEKEGFEKGHAEGYDEGYKHAYQEFVAKVPCAVCGEPVAINTERQREELYNTVDKINLDWSAQPPLGTLKCNIQHDECS